MTSCVHFTPDKDSTPHTCISAVPHQLNLAGLEENLNLEKHSISEEKKMLTPVSICTTNLHSSFALQGDLRSQN